MWEWESPSQALNEDTCFRLETFNLPDPSGILLLLSLLGLNQSCELTGLIVAIHSCSATSV